MTETQTRTPENEALDASRELFERAREAMLGMFRIEPSADPAKTVAAVTEKVVESQRRAYELMNGMAEVWTGLAKNGGGHDAWRDVLDRTTKMMSASSPADPRELFDAWRRQGEKMFAGLGATGEGAGPFGGLSAFGGAGSHQAITGFLSSPGFGLTREHQTQMGELFESWLDLQQREHAYRAALGAAWTEAFRKMTEQMASMTSEGKRVEHVREFLDLWVKVADGVFTEHFHTREFSRAQAEMLNAAHRFRSKRRALTEDMLRANDLPTRSDLDEAHRMIHDLRRELRGVRREMAELRRGKDTER